MNKTTLKALCDSERPLLLPVAHDALSARLVEQAGFSAYAIGGFAIAGCHYGLPDIGVVSFGEMVGGVRNIMMGSSLPVLVDADDGYGDVKSVARTVETYERMGVSGIVLEDQASPKRCGHMQGKKVVAEELAVKKLEAALRARADDDFMIVARTDALAIHGLENAIRRAELFAAAGVDAVFVEAPGTVEELRIIADRLADKAALLVNMGEGGRTPILEPKILADMGYSLVVYPSSILQRVIRGVQEGLDWIRGTTGQAGDGDLSVRDMAEILGIGKWEAIDQAAGDASIDR